MAEKMFTKEELAQYDGQNGHPAYVAVDGIVYDVTNSPAWPNGAHHGNQAGQDLTKELHEDSPHGASKLTQLPVVGKLKGR
ncbi:cytochrome b5 domain-containing protein [Limosilactobacillus reuteri]|uniref:cytochrome b5 domain-containing protein n=1 Tax=Limosilactobacillus reuteri TaxID=1598 RepID=UPI001E4CC8DB|nr:cytochrome b5 domain-containing protein [Limosilactobacillus reuteri]MCC4489894.1 cytochrome B5 [Limosilactobacillus reuteri]MCC4494057.1 cytochrome B5 [Limosilactobacillus reuteri]MCC4496548.1 cytochrome B5 [Limosilactobacillus reuteri]